MKTHIKTQTLILAAALTLPMGAFAGDGGIADRMSDDDSWIERNAEPLHEDRVNGHKYASSLNTLPPTAAGPQTPTSEMADMRPARETAHQYKLRVFGPND